MLQYMQWLRKAYKAFVGDSSHKHAGAVMKYWIKALNALRDSDRTFSAIYSVVFSFSENNFFEWSADGRIRSMTYRECQSLVEASAKRIVETLTDTPHNSFVALSLENSPAWVIAFWAILMAGFRPLLVNTRLDHAQNARLLDMANVAAVVSDKPFDDYPFINANVMTTPPLAGEGFTPRWADQIALCSSGTSGRPKLCVYDGSSISAQIFNSLHVLRRNPTIKTYYKGRIKLLAFLPFYHIFGLVANLLWFSFFGRSFVFLRDISAAGIMDACRRHGVTHVFAIPLLFNAIAAGVRKKASELGASERLDKALRVSIRLQTLLPRLGARFVRGVLMRGVRQRALGPSVRFCITGGGFVSADTLYLCNALGYALYNGYGMTEIGIGSVELRLRVKDRLSGSVGQPFPSAAYRIDNGELLVRGPTLFSAMLEDGREMARDEEAWYRTGDMARQDEDGFYHIDGRLDDLIVTSGGENLLPNILEQHFQLEHVRQLCVVGLRDETQRPVVTLVIEPEAALPSFIMERMLRQAFDINRALPLHQQAERILVAGEPLPIVMDGKVQRQEVRQRIMNGRLSCHEVKPAATGPAAVSREYQQALDGMMALFAEVLDLDIAQIGPDTHLVRDLACSSLQYFTLLSRIAEKYRVSFDPSEGTPCATPQEFTAYILGDH